MKFNNTYEQNINLKKTIQEINKIEDEIKNIFKSDYTFLKIMPPHLYKEGDIYNISQENLTRDISFELGFSQVIATLPNSHANWVKDIINKMKLSAKEILFFQHTKILRDIEENTHNSVAKNETLFYLVVDKETGESQTLKIVGSIYRKILEMSKEKNMTYNLKNHLPESPNFITAQQLENEFPDLSFKEREDEIILNLEAFILKKSGFKLFSGKRHNLLPPEVYDLNNTYEFLLKDHINSDAINIGSVAILASGDQLKDQLTSYDLGTLAEKHFYKKEIADNKKIIEIKINIPQLTQSLLQKGHIAELQPGVLSEEANMLKNKNDIEIY